MKTLSEKIKKKKAKQRALDILGFSNSELRPFACNYCKKKPLASDILLQYNSKGELISKTCRVPCPKMVEKNINNATLHRNIEVTCTIIPSEGYIQRKCRFCNAFKKHLFLVEDTQHIPASFSYCDDDCEEEYFEIYKD